MKELWSGNAEAAKRIFEFFGVQYVVRDHHAMKIYEGEYGGKALWLMFSSDNTDFFCIQFRNLDTGCDMGGALIHSCYDIDFQTEIKSIMTPEGTEEKEYKFIIVTSSGGNVSISSDGVHADIR